MNFKYCSLIILLFFSFNVVYSQCVQTLNTLEKVELAAFICQGKVIDKDFFLSEEDAHIYTIYLLEIHSTEKGRLETDSIQLVLRGGQWNDIIELVHPNLSLQLGDSGTFYLANNNIPLSPTHQWNSYLAYQGAIGSQSFTPINNSSNKEIEFPIIESFSPDTIEAGTNSVLTIHGQNFGPNANGLANVKFRNPDFYNITFSYQSVPPNHILSWSDTEIQVLIPGNDPLIGHAGAGTGPIRVISSNGDEAESADSLKVTINKLVLGLAPIHLVNHNEYGGYTLTYNQDFYNDESARAASESALQTWQCNSQTNIFTNKENTSINCATNDGINLIAYDYNCELAPATLAETTHWIYDCGNDGGIILEMDLIINASINWNSGPESSNSDQKDLESLLLHEFGHAQGLAHTSDFSGTMYPAQYNGIDRRTIDTYSSKCAKIIKTHSETAYCNHSDFTPYIAAQIIIHAQDQSCLLDTIYHSANPDFDIYPNPIASQQALFIKGIPVNEMGAFVTFRIHSTNGQLLLEKEVPTQSIYSFNEQLITTLPTGLYILSMESDNNFYKKRFFKW